MPTPPDLNTRGEVLAAVRGVRRRLATSHLLEGAAVGLLLAAGVAAIARASGWTWLAAALTVGLVASLSAFTWFNVRRSVRTDSAAADRIERRHRGCHNLVVTAVELIQHPERARPWMFGRVVADAGRMLAGVDAREVVPLRRRAATCAGAAALASAVILGVHERTAQVIVSSIGQEARRAAAGGLAIVATLRPPPHITLPPVTLSQPDRLSAVEGTSVLLTFSGPVSPGQVRFGNQALELRRDAEAARTELTLRESGYFAIDVEGGSRLIPVTVTPDRAPAIKVDRPGRDLVVPTASRAIPVETHATDDFGLTELALRYTKVSGSGEQFEFVEGELPLAIERQNSLAWHGRGELALSRLGLEPGDSLVYRVVARDARRGDSGLATSDTFFVEVAGPGQVALEGFEMPPDRERYAISQQMIVLKIQRLRERERSLDREAVREQSGGIAVEQRTVRAHFVFLTGGHVEDEEEEAEQSHEIQEGRLENTTRREISRAIGHMTRAEQGLVAVDTATALAQAKLAVDALQRAFGRNRYILRTLPVRSRIDPSRRLSGRLDEASEWTRKLPDPARDLRSEAVRALLADMIAMRETLTSTEAASSAKTVGALMERALAIDPADPTWHQISSRLAALRDAIASRAAREAIDARYADAVSPVVAEARRASIPAGPAGIDPESSGRLRGAWAEELRKRAGR